MTSTSTQFQIFYRHKNCRVRPGIKWQDQWSCACNGQCPACGTKDIEPYDYEEIEQPGTAHIAEPKSPSSAAASPIPGPYVAEPLQADHGASIAIVSRARGCVIALIPFDDDIQGEDSPDARTVRRHPDEIPTARFLAAAWTVMEALKLTVDFIENVRAADPDRNQKLQLARSAWRAAFTEAYSHEEI